MSSSSRTILITGGAGFLGYHITESLLRDSAFSSVCILSRTATENPSSHIPGARYYSCDITDHDAFQQALQEIKPTLIIHAASAPPTKATVREFQAVTVGGTENVLRLALESEHVQALIYTSSSTLYRGPEHVDVKEDYPLADTDHAAALYSRAKATADRMILDSNKLPAAESPAMRKASWSGYLATGALRFPIVYGTRNGPETGVHGSLAALRRKETKVMVGDGRNLWSYCSVQNVAESHLLLSRALLSEDRARVAGEAFNINDGEPRLFWGFVRDVWRVAGHEDKSDLTVKIPTWFAVALANVLEFLFWVFTLGRKRPGLLGRQQVDYCCFHHTYSIEKSRRMLGFVPKQDFEESLRKAVRWVQEECKNS
jgi:sterol-4alpha-carboxylate 3-dehydrogenase (decarboxylating)